MRSAYQSWLEKKYDLKSASSRLSNTKRVENLYGDLEQQFALDRCTGIFSELSYSSEDERRRLPNPSKIPIEGDFYNNLATYRSALKLYCEFLESCHEGAAAEEIIQPAFAETETENEVQRIGLERDLQGSLRTAIEQLESGLVIIDDGAERSVDSGRIDITARDPSGATVVIELKAGIAGQRAVAQVLSYMGDIAMEEPNVTIRGILVAHAFDAKAKAAARVVPSLSLRRYSIRFQFHDGSS